MTDLATMLDEVRRLAGTARSPERDVALVDAASLFAEQHQEHGAILLWPILSNVDDPLPLRTLAFVASLERFSASRLIPLSFVLAEPSLSDTATTLNCLTALGAAAATNPAFLVPIRSDVQGFVLHALRQSAVHDACIDFIVDGAGAGWLDWLFTSPQRLELKEEVVRIGHAAGRVEIKSDVEYLLESGAFTAPGRIPPLPPLDDVRAGVSALRDCVDCGVEYQVAFTKADGVLAAWESSRIVCELGLPVQELRVTTRTGRPDLDLVSLVLQRWNNLVSSIARNLFHAHVQLVPVGARTGSFILRFAVAGSEDLATIFSKLKELVESNNRALLGQILKHPGADAVGYAELLRTLQQEESSITVSMMLPGESRWSDQLTLAPEDAAVRLSVVEDFVSKHLDSSQVPQADRLDRLLALLDLVSQGERVTPENLAVVSRQVLYYRHAARVLGTLTEGGHLTSAGRRVVRLAGDDRLRALAELFASSDCGWAWIVWSNGSELADVVADSAEQFLEQIAPGLSPSTRHRRALTLRSWHADLARFSVDQQRRDG